MDSGKCAICNSLESTPCTRCGTVFYCGKDHQKMHWDLHKSNCKPYTIRINKKMGRYMVAARDIKAGELILKEFPAIVGPKTNSSLLCLGCFRVLSENYRLCGRCGIAPVCGTNCELKSSHAEYECEYYQKFFGSQVERDFIASNMQLVMPLKCLACKTLSDGNDLWENFIGLESHTEKRQKDPIWNFYEERLINVLHSAGLIKKKDFSLLQKICGILDVNCFELRGPSNEADLLQNEQLRGIFIEAAFMSHDCIGNTHVSVDDHSEMTIHASLSIKAGEPILFNYSNPFESTIDRLQRLKEGKYFDCTCKRCSDPTELGTYMGSIICPRCHDGCVISDGSLSNLSKWCCEKCNHEFYKGLVQTAIAEGRALIEDTDITDPELLENLLAKCSKSFPQTSVVNVDIKQKLLASLHNIILKESHLKNDTLKRNIILCQELVTLLEVIEPGISRLKGITLYQLHKSKLILTEKAYDSNEITTKEFLDQLKDCENVLKHAISLLIYEPYNSPEGRLLKVALSELKNLRKEISNIHLLSKKETRKRK